MKTIYYIQNAKGDFFCGVDYENSCLPYWGSIGEGAVSFETEIDAINRIKTAKEESGNRYSDILTITKFYIF